MPGSYREILGDGKGDPFDQTWRNIATSLALDVFDQPFVMLHFGESSHAREGEEKGKEEDVEDYTTTDEGGERPGIDVGFTRHT